MNKMTVYNSLPIFAQNLACYYEGSRIKRTRYGDTFWKYLKEYESRNNWSHEQLCEYRDAKLRKMIKHCYETVPYYTKLFNDLKIDFRSIKRVDDLKVIPILTKQNVKDNFNDFISTAFPPEKRVLVHTSGTTGSGFKFYTTNEAISEQWAVWWRYRRNLGINLDMWHGNFGGKPVVPLKQKKPPFWRENRPVRQTYFSSYHLNEKNLHTYFHYINKRQLKWLHGYPSSIALLATFMLEKGLSLDYKLNFITIGSESLLQHQKEIIKRAFGVAPYQHYGLAESVANISQHLDENLYVDEDFAAVEFVPIDGAVRIVGTTLNNFCMPLLRYDTSDVAQIDMDYKPVKLGRKVLSIDGRKDDYIVLNDGRKIGRLSTLFHEMINIREAQIYQQYKGRAVIKIVKNRSYSESDEKFIANKFKERIGDDFHLKFEYLDELPKTKNGKLRFVISEVK